MQNQDVIPIILPPPDSRMLEFIEEMRQLLFKATGVPADIAAHFIKPSTARELRMVAWRVHELEQQQFCVLRRTAGN